MPSILQPAHKIQTILQIAPFTRGISYLMKIPHFLPSKLDPTLPSKQERPKTERKNRQEERRKKKDTITTLPVDADVQQFMMSQGII